MTFPLAAATFKDFMRQNGINRARWTPANEFSLAETEHIGGMRTPVNRVHLQAPLMIFSKKHWFSLATEQFLLHFCKSRKKIDLRNRQGGFQSKALRSQHLAKSSQAMPIPGTAGEAAESTFRWKRSTFESSRGGVVKHCSTAFVKRKVSRGQEALFEECTFPMWSPCRPETTQ